MNKVTLIRLATDKVVKKYVLTLENDGDLMKNLFN
ncbi:hypothetical protein GvMRE_IIg415 [endosymbiont GvMRE of Glomus versiforme]|nr:hypothetical protein GvMRE_IIg415 [endosymbiont GvMRE of Glomus versiforme]